MQFFRPKPPQLNSAQIKPKSPTTFGQARAEALEERLDVALKERRQLARAQHAAPKELHETLGERAAVVSNKIDRLKLEKKQVATELSPSLSAPTHYDIDNHD